LGVWEEILVLQILRGVLIDFAFSLISPNYTKKDRKPLASVRYISPSASSQSLSILSILSGGGDYRGIYDIGLKRGFYEVWVSK
jgi:hypothetical protein